MLQTLRTKAAGLVAKFLFVFLIASFAIWGIGDYAFLRQSDPTAVTVGDVTISATRLGNEYRRELENLRRRLGQFDDEAARQFGLMERVIERLVSQVILDKAATALGIPVGLGTDGAASNNSLDMFGVMKSCGLLQKVSAGDAAILPAERILAMGTVDGARALGLQDEVGSLEPGKKADLIAVRVDRPEMVPLHSVYESLVYSAAAAAVDTVVVDGRAAFATAERFPDADRLVVGWLDERVVIITAADRWKARSLARGRDRARIWVGDAGRSQSLLGGSGAFRDHPHFDAVAERSSDGALLDRLLADYERKYPGEIASWRDRDACSRHIDERAAGRNSGDDHGTGCGAGPDHAGRAGRAPRLRRTRGARGLTKRGCVSLRGPHRGRTTSAWVFLPGWAEDATTRGGEGEAAGR